MLSMRRPEPPRLTPHDQLRPPTHIESAFAKGRSVARAPPGLRANASRRSHAELNGSPDLDDGDPVELGGQYRELIKRFPNISVLGGCCGTDDRHVACIGSACRLAGWTDANGASL